MTLLEQAIERLRALPATERESAAESVLAVVRRYEEPSRLSPKQIEEVRRLDAEAEAGRLEMLSDKEMAAMWHRLGA